MSYFLLNSLYPFEGASIAYIQLTAAAGRAALDPPGAVSMRSDKRAMLKIISANRLEDGIVVYLVAEGAWTPDINHAQRFASDAALETGLRLAKADEKRNLVVDPFAVDVEAETQGLEALTLRNAIRAKGPTVDYRPRQDQSPRS
jgi:Protein of unknown function (DUF2849)